MFLKWLSSFLFVRQIEVLKSEFNPYLEVVLVNGRFMLNAENVNYAFGSLDKVWRKAFRIIGLKNRNFKKILVLGLGPGNIPSIFSTFNNDFEITGVEIDQVVIEIGEKYFGLGKLKNLEIVVDDASHFVRNCKVKFDLICVDLFIDEKTPEVAESKEFLERVGGMINPGGMLLFNRLMHKPFLSRDSEIFSEKMGLILPGTYPVQAAGNRILVYENK